MMPGPTVIYACPACGQLARLCTLGSGNTFGARWWTDGKMEAPMLPRMPEIAHCQGCGGFYWLDKDREIGTISNSWDLLLAPEEARPVPDEWRRAPMIDLLDEQELMSAINSRAASGVRRERKLRILLWWKGNDRFREKYDRASQRRLAQDEPLKAGLRAVPARQYEAPALEHRANMERLHAILEAREPKMRLMKAELARELGLFEECLALLAPPFRKQFRTAAELIRGLADQGIAAVAEIRD